jgi:hypothetical protein
MAKITRATPEQGYVLRIESLPYYSLNDPERFRDFTVEPKAIRWKDVEVPGQAPMPVRLTVDTILFAIRE